MSNPRDWWYGFIKRAIQESPNYRDRIEPEYVSFCNAIDKAKEDVLKTVDGKEQMQAVERVMFNREDVSNVADTMYYCEEKIYRWNRDFVKRVARYKGY